MSYMMKEVMSSVISATQFVFDWYFDVTPPSGLVSAGEEPRESLEGPKKQCQ